MRKILSSHWWIFVFAHAQKRICVENVFNETEKQNKLRMEKSAGERERKVNLVRDLLYTKLTFVVFR